MGPGAPHDLPLWPAQRILAGCGVLLSGGVAVAGFGCGLGGCRQKDRNPLFVIFGLIVSGLIVVGICKLLLLIGMLMMS